MYLNQQGHSGNTRTICRGRQFSVKRDRWRQDWRQRHCH